MYDYAKERPKLFSDDGIQKILETKDRVQRLISEAGCCTVEKALCSGDSWTALAVIDYLVEIGEIRKIENPSWRNHSILIK